MVIWFIGVSGSGKTTLGEKLEAYLNMKYQKNCIIDGDKVRRFYDNDLGYTKEDREANIKRIMLSAYLLEENKIIPIICNISPFQTLRDFSCQKFDQYIEIYLQRELDDIENKEYVYDSKNVVGQDIEFEVPKNPNLCINTSVLTIEESLALVVKHIGI